MTDAQRAKQFAPYAALTGFGDYIRSMETETAERVFLGEDAQEALNRDLQRLRIGDMVTIRYYNGQAYTQTSGAVRRLCPEEGTIMLDRVYIDLADIVAVKVDVSAAKQGLHSS